MSRRLSRTNFASLAQKLSLVAREVVEGVVTGVHSSPFHGYSAEFDEYRKYTTGDSLRDIDWTVYARTDRYYIKKYREETNLFCRIIIDASGSMDYPKDPDKMSKFDYARFFAASLGWLCLRQRDAVGLVIAGGENAIDLAPSGKPAQMQLLVHSLENAVPAKQAGLATAFETAARKMRRRGMIVAISDMLEDEEPLLKALKHLRNRRHEVMLFHILDETEETLPFKDITEFKDLENGQTMLTDPATLKPEYTAAISDFRQRVAQACAARQIDYLPVTTGQPFEDQLRKFLVRRMERH